MRKKINPVFIFTVLATIVGILIINRPKFEDHPVRTKQNPVQVETQALHNINKPIIDVSGWQRPSEINYDTLTQNISGAIVRVHSGAQVSVENDASFKNGVDKAYKEHITEFQKRNVPVAVYAYVAGKNVEEMEKAAEAFYNAASPYNPSYYWLDVDVYFMEEHSISVDNYSAIWIPSYGTNSGYYESAPKTDLSYDLHQYTSHGNLGGFEHHLDLNLISSSENKEETFRKLFLNP